MKVEHVILIIVSIITCLQLGGTMGSPRPVCYGFGGYHTCCVLCLNCQEFVKGFSFSKCDTWCTVSYYTNYNTHELFFGIFDFRFEYFLTSAFYSTSFSAMR